MYSVPDLGSQIFSLDRETSHPCILHHSIQFVLSRLKFIELYEIGYNNYLHKGGMVQFLITIHLCSLDLVTPIAKCESLISNVPYWWKFAAKSNYFMITKMSIHHHVDRKNLLNSVC